MNTNCPKCNNKIDHGMKFCQTCGCKIEIELNENYVCPKCKLNYPANTRFCANDGSKLIKQEEFLGEEYKIKNNIEVNSIRHEKEKIYLNIMLIIGGLFWLVTILLLWEVMSLTITLGLILIYGIPFVLTLWILGLYFKTIIYGDSVKVTAKQYPEIYKLSVEYSQKLNLDNIPEIFIYNGSGLINAFAIKFLSKKYVILMSDLVDLMLKRNKIDELSMIIGHELGHHAAGHTNPWKNLLLKPANFIPLLGAAYSRACELTADRIGYEVTRNIHASQNALVSIALGSESLASETNIDEFILQENEIPEFMGFIHKIFSTHPRMTRRVIEVTNYHKSHNNF